MGGKLRSMTVEKGLLRETKVIHQMIDAVVECKVCGLISKAEFKFCSQQGTLVLSG